MSLSSTDKGLLTPDNCAVIFIDHQPQMFFGVANIDRQDLLNNVLVLAKAAKIFGVPVILTAVRSEEFCGNWPRYRICRYYGSWISGQSERTNLQHQNHVKGFLCDNCSY